MAKLIVFNSVKWKPPVKSKLLNPPELKLDVSFPGKDLDEMTKKHRAAFDKEFKAFDAKFNKLGIKKIKDVQSAIDWTEERIKKKKTKEEAEKTIDTANVMLKKAFQAFEGEIKTLAQKCYDEALKKSFKKMKMRLVRTGVKALVIIGIIALLTLTAAGVTVVAGIGVAVGTVATAGGLAAAIAAAIGLTVAVVAAVITAITAIISVIGTVKKYWMTVEKQIAVVEKDIETLKKASETLEKLKALAKSDYETAGEKLQKFKAGMNGKILVNFDKHIGQLDKFIFKTTNELKKMRKEVEMIEKKIAKSKDKSIPKKAKKLKHDIINGELVLKKVEKVKKESKLIQDKFVKLKSPKLSKLEKLLRDLHEFSPIIGDMFKGAKGLQKSISGAAG